MRSKVFLISGLLVLTLVACSLVNLPATVTVTPPIITDTPIPTATVRSLPSPTLLGMSIASAPDLTHIAFLDPNNGWGIASNEGGSILRTMDGGTTWLNATPPGLTSIGYSTNLSVMNVVTAWVLVPNPDFFTGVLYRTFDGGITWTSFEVPFGGGSLQFLDANTGRVLADRGAGAGSQSVEMFQSSDGGATWLSVFNNDPTRPDSSNSLPLSGDKNGMIFIDANTGWVTGTRPMEGDIYLFVTHDGGISWEQQSIPLPTGYETYQYMPQAPIFFNNNGFLPLMVYRSNTTDFTFYTSQNGGDSWTGNPTNASQVITPSLYSFADSLHGWGWDGGTFSYFTTDGTQTWGRTSVTPDLTGRLSQLLFVAGSSGQFTGWALTIEDNAGHSKLYKSIDNGSTWNLLNP
jgi:photosystem II stability/assembly factor-like uncharacterized protein